MKGYKINRMALAVALFFSSGAALAESNFDLTPTTAGPTIMDDTSGDGVWEWTGTGDGSMTGDGVGPILPDDISDSDIYFIVDTWWANYQTSQGFKEAIAQLGLTIKQMAANPDEMEARAKNPNDPLFWLKRTLEIYPADKNSYAIPITENGGGAARQTTWERENYFLTRTYARAGEKVTIEVGHIPDKVTCYVANKATELMQKAPNNKDVMKLPANALFTYPVKNDGLLALGCMDSTKTLESLDKIVNMRIVSGGVEHPLYILGQQPRSEWSSLSRQVTPSGNIVMFDGRSNYYISNAKARASADTDVLHAMAQTLVQSTVYDKLNGMDGSSTLHQPNRGLFTANYNACCYAGSWDGLVSIGFGGNLPANASWGEWHEYGHQHQNRALWWGGLSEVIVNIYSLTACYTQLGDVDPKKCHGNLSMDWDQQAVGNFLKSGQTYQMDTETNVFRKLTMFAQLLTSYPDMYPALNKAIREAFSHNKNRALIDTDQKKKDWFVVHASRFSGYDLREFFTRWGLTYSDAAGEQISAMKLPVPAQPAATYETPLIHSGATPTTAKLVIEGTAEKKPIGFIANTEKVGPRALTWSGPDESRLHAQVVDAQHRAFTVTLRGKRSMGGCASHAVNKVSICASGTRTHLSVSYHPQDNPDLPAGEYHGILPLIATNMQDKTWTANVTIPLTISK